MPTVFKRRKLDGPTKFFAAFLIIFAVVLIWATIDAKAQSGHLALCSPTEQLDANIKRQDSTQEATLQLSNREAGAVITLYTSTVNMKWVLIITNANNISCVIGAGEGVLAVIRAPGQPT